MNVHISNEHTRFATTMTDAWTTINNSSSNRRLRISSGYANNGLIIGWQWERVRNGGRRRVRVSQSERTGLVILLASAELLYRASESCSIDERERVDKQTLIRVSDRWVLRKHYYMFVFRDFESLIMSTYQLGTNTRSFVSPLCCYNNICANNSLFIRTQSQGASFKKLLNLMLRIRALPTC